jgi:hypothetical protein
MKNDESWTICNFKKRANYLSIMQSNRRSRSSKRVTKQLD